MKSRKSNAKAGAVSRNVWLIGAVTVVAAVGAFAISQGGDSVEAIRPYRGEIRESFREPARTRLENTSKIAVQVSARIGRIQLEPGDSVKRGQTLVEVDTVPLNSAVEEAQARIARLRAQLDLIDDTSVEEAELAVAQARAESMEDQVGAASAVVDAARARLKRAQVQRKRIAELLETGASDRGSMDDANLAATEALKAFHQAQSDLGAQESMERADKLSTRQIQHGIERKQLVRRETVAQLAEAEAHLATALHDLQLAKVVSPIDGVVLERYERGERPVTRGTPLLLLGNPDDIEVIADVLTEDALRLGPGAEVSLENLAGETLLIGHVKRIDPQGFTKLSSLGVEQQRVNVIVSMENPPPGVGVGYRLHARFITGTKSDALIVPRFCILQASDQSYYVMAIEDGALVKRAVALGFRSDLELEIASGLDENSVIVLHPEATMEVGARVSAAFSD